MCILYRKHIFTSKWLPRIQLEIVVKSYDEIIFLTLENSLCKSMVRGGKHYNDMLTCRFYQTNGLNPLISQGAILLQQHTAAPEYLHYHLLVFRRLWGWCNRKKNAAPWKTNEARFPMDLCLMADCFQKSLRWSESLFNLASIGIQADIGIIPEIQC